MPVHNLLFKLLKLENVKRMEIQLNSDENIP